MQELPRRKRARLLTDIAFATTLAAAAGFSIAVAQAQVVAPSSQDQLKPQNKDGSTGEENKEPSTIGETHAAPAPQLPADQMRPPISGKPLDEPDKALNSAPPEKMEGK